MTLAPHFRNPYAAASLTDFWARRWNITQGLVLRFFVYEPIVEGRLLPAAPAAAVPVQAAKPSRLKAEPSAEGAVQQLHAKAGQLKPTRPAVAAAAAAGKHWPVGLRQRGSGSSSRLMQPGCGAAVPLAANQQLAANCSHTDTSCAAVSEDSGSTSDAGLLRGHSSSSSSDDDSATSTNYDPYAAAAAAAMNAAAAAAAARSQPLLSQPSSYIASRWRRQLAAAATFFVSGIEHELFMAYATHALGWRWLAFFSLQGLLLALEGGLKRRAAVAGLSLHPAVASLAVLLVLGVTADALFCE
jgi:hypothetical protein